MANGYSSSSSTQNISTRISAEATDSVVNNISSFIIDTSSMPSEETNRKFVVAGDKGAQFKIIALQNPASSSSHTLYYNWVDKSFAAGHNNLNNNLIITLDHTTYNNNILFPSGVGEFVIKLIPINETTITKSTGKIITKNISKIATNATVTFTPGTFTTTAVNYATLPTTTSTGGVNSTNNFSFNWDVINASHDSYGFGLRLTGDITRINDSFWYFQTTDTVNGTVSSSTTVVVDDITDIVVGMSINEVSSGSLTGTPRISAINTVTKTLTLSSAQTFADGITLYFRAYSSTYIRSATGLDVTFDLDPTVTPTTLIKTVRTDVSSSTSVTLTDTLGLAGGNHVTYKGVGVNNDGNNAVTSVTEDFDGTDTDGVAVVQLAQTLPQGTELEFTGSHAKINFAGIIRISQYPTANKTIYLDLEKMITVGAAS